MAEDIEYWEIIHKILKKHDYPNQESGIKLNFNDPKKVDFTEKVCKYPCLIDSSSSIFEEVFIDGSSVHNRRG